MGAERGAMALDSDGQLVVARPEAVYFYTPDGRGPCFVFEGALARLPSRAQNRSCVLLCLMTNPKGFVMMMMNIQDMLDWSIAGHMNNAMEDIQVCHMSSGQPNTTQATRTVPASLA